jgi:predicted HTH transcriptional regulator
MLTPSDIHTLVRAGEGPQVEFKVGTPFPDNLARLISGFANTSGGTLIVGIKEPAVVAGTDPKRFNTFVKLGLGKVQGEVAYNHYTVDIDGKTLGILEISPSKVPVASAEGYFKRVGESEQLLSSQDLVTRMASVSNHSAALDVLSETITSQSKLIEKLQASFDAANSWKRKAFYAVLGAIAGAAAKAVLAAVGLAVG